MRDTIFSGIGSLLSVMASHVRRCSKLGADAPHHFSRISISFDHRQSPLATQPRWARSLDLAGQDDPRKNLPGSELPPPRCLPPPRDRKSTRLNSSHMSISYAVFCLKKKKKKNTTYHKIKKKQQKTQK